VVPTLRVFVSQDRALHVCRRCHAEDQSRTSVGAEYGTGKDERNG